MENRDKEILQKILGHAEHAIEYASKYKDCKEFQADQMCVEATVFNLMQIGELAKVSLSNEAKAAIKTIPWNQIYGMRNRIVHGYEGVNFTIVWDTIKDDLPELVKEIKEAVNK